MIGVITPLETCSEAKEVLDDDDEDVGEVVRQAQVGYSVSVVPAQFLHIQVGLSRATLEFQVCKILSIVKISKLDPSVSKICCQKNWLNFDKVCINLTSPDLTCLDLTKTGSQVGIREV